MEWIVGALFGLALAAVFAAVIFEQSRNGRRRSGGRR